MTKVSFRTDWLPALVLATMLAGCSASNVLVDEYLDPGTGNTITRSTAALVFYRDIPSVAAYARDLIHLGAIEVNRAGDFRYFLWVGAWKTMDSDVTGRQNDSFYSIAILADGEPLLLDVAGWTPDAIGASTSVYTKPVASALDAYFYVTADQVRLIAQASDVRIRTLGSVTREYVLWENQANARHAFAAFVHEVM